MRRFIILISSLLILFPFQYALAIENQTRPSILSTCTAEAERFCAGVTNFKLAAQCLKEHDEDLSESCKQGLDRYVGAMKQAAARGGGALTSFGGLNAMGPPLPLFSYEGRVIPGDNTATRQYENKVNLSAPFYKTTTDTYALSLAAGQVHLGDHLQLSSGQNISTDFYRREVGVQYSHKLSNERSLGLRASGGYAGDKLSAAAKDMSYSVSGTYGFPGAGSGYWVLMLFMANNSPLANYVPVPGFMYIYKTETFSGMFGFPIMSMQWTPLDPWAFSLALFGPTLQAEAAYGHIDNFQSFVAYSYAQQSFIPNVRVNERDRLTLHEQKAGIGFRVPIIGTSQGELQAGRSFDRSIYVGEKVLNKDGGQVAMNSDWFVSWAFKYAF